MRSAVTFTQRGDFSNTKKFLKRVSSKNFQQMLHAYGKRGVEILSAVTPKKTGLTAASWDYNIEITKDSITINWTNSNISQGIPVALLIEWGHATRNGGWVEGIDYINPVMQPIFDEMSREIWREVTK